MKADMISPADKEKDFLSLKETQIIYLELLVEFTEICKNYQLRYDLCGGTMLGAVRHQGFIPWDDDIDVSMPRPDYEKLLELVCDGKLEMRSDRDIISDRNDTLARNFARYIRKDVGRVSRSGFEEANDCPFVGIDIFTVDGMPSNNFEMGVQLFVVKQLRRLTLTSVQKKNTSRKGKLAAHIKNIYRPILKKIGPYNLARMSDKICSLVRYENAEYVGIVNGMYGKKERWKKEDMLPQKLFSFEGEDYYGYVNADMYLSNLYGKDFMSLPPEEKRKPHGALCYLIKDEKQI